MAEIVIDNLDKAIISELQANGRMPFRKIAEKHGISIGTIHNRVKKLQDEGILKGFIPNISLESLGFSLTAIFQITVKGGILMDTKEKLLAFPEIKILYNTSGTHDFMGVAKLKGMIEFTEFASRISALKDGKVEINLVIEQMKEDAVFYP